MKKITLLCAFLFLIVWGSYAQCIRTSMYPSSPVVSNNLGLPQTINSQPYTSEYSQVDNLIEGSDYIFTCQAGTTNKYITVTDLTNTVIAYGDSPLTVEAITSTQVRLHYSDNAACASTPFVGHTITITAVLDCSPPVNLAVSDITTTAATFTWEPQGEETAWQVLVLPNGTAAPTDATTGTDVIGNPTYTDLTTLSSANKYQFYVRANCSSESSPWNGPLNFASACDPITLFTENFDAIAYGQLPVCWTQVKNGTGSSQYSYARVTDYNFNSPSRTAQLYSENSGTTANLILVAPEVSNLAAGTHRLKFFAKCGSGTQSIQFGTMDNTTADGVFTALEAITVTNVYEEYAIDYTVYDGTDNFIAIRHNGTQYSSVFIDDIRWEVAPLCADVSQITIPGTTITPATAVVTWTANGGETEWDVVYGPTTVTDPATLTPIAPAPTGTAEASLAGLTDNTSYKVWVRSVCGENEGVWVGPKTFKTACLPNTVINETFDAYAYGTLPGCWTAVKNGTGASQYAYAQVADSNFFSASRSAQLYNDNSPATANIMLISPVLSNINAGTYRLKFYAKSGGATGSLQVGTVDTNTTDASFSSSQTIALTSTYTEYVVEFLATDVTDTYLAFRHNTTASYNSVYIDNVIWELIPQCSDVTAVTVPTATVNSATINWIPGESETEWDLVYGESTVTDPNTLTPIAPAPTVNAEATLNGLTDNTSYKVWVRSVCGAQNGAWIGPVAFKTPCLPVTTFEENFDTSAYNTIPQCWSVIKNGTGVSQYASVYVIDYNFYSASRALYMNNSDSGTSANIVLASPNLGNVAAGTHRVKFFARSGSATGSVQVGTVDNTNGSAVFTEVETVALTSTYTEYAINFTEYDGTDTNIAFRHNGGGMYTYVYLDNIRWEVAPLCADVAAVAVTDITTETASVSWESQGSETNWQVVYGPASTTDPTTLTPSDLLTVTNFPLSGLTENTSYKVWVRSACGAPNGDGMWIGPKQFTTQCLATTVPFIQDFESAVTPAMPSCTTLQNLSVANNFITSSPGNYGFTSKVLQYSYNCSTSAAANAWYYTKGLTLTGGTEYTISYKYGGNTTPGGSYVEKLKVMYGTGTDADSMAEELADHTFTINVPTTNEVTFVPETSGVYYFGFNAYSAACQNNIYIDDIAIQEVLKTDNFNGADFKFYPNPVKNTLNLSYTQNISTVSVFNLLGQKVLENTINAASVQVDMSGLASGSYLVKVASDNQTKTIKVIKE